MLIVWVLVMLLGLVTVSTAIAEVNETAGWVLFGTVFFLIGLYLNKLEDDK